MAKAMPREYHEMSNSLLVPLAYRGDYGARYERFVREVMTVDNVDFATAAATVKQASAANRRMNAVWKLPYYIGIGTALGAGLLSFPMVFDVSTALWFDETYVTAEIPPPSELLSVLEVGSWTWGWMEPPMGQISFFLLALQWARSQMINISAKPFSNWMVAQRGKSLAATYPNYNENIVKDFAEVDMFYKECEK